MKKNGLRPGAAAFVVMMAMALTSSGISYFVARVCGELQVSRAAFTFYYSLMLVVNMCLNPMHGQLLRRKNVRTMLWVGAAWNAVVFMLFACSGKLWHFYVAGALLGVFSNSFLSLCASVIVQRCYSGSHTATAMGIVMAGSGAGGVCLSVGLTAVLERFSWRAGYGFLSLLWAVLLVSAALLLGDAGRPVESSAAASGASGGVTREQALRSPWLYLAFLLMFLLGCGCAVQQQIPAVLASMDVSAERVSVYMTVFSFAIALGKAGQGWLYGKIGVARGGMLVIGCYALSYLLLLDVRFIVPALVLLATGMGTVTTMMSLLGRALFGSRDYAAIWSIVMMASSLSVMVCSPGWGKVYDATGSYRGGMVIAFVLLVGAMVLHGILVRQIREER